MKDRWQTIGDMHESYNLNYYNYITELTITGNFDFSLPNNLIYLDCSHSELLSLPELPNTLTHLYCGYNQLSSLPELPQNLVTINHCENPFNLWTALIDPTKINTEYAEIIYEKLNILDYKIKDLESRLNKNIIEEILYKEIIDEDEDGHEQIKNKIGKYNKKMSELKKEIDKILNFKFEIVL